MARATPQRPHYFARLWRELGRMGGEHDAFIKVIIVERIVKAIVLIALAIGLLVAGERGWLASAAQYAQGQLNLDADQNVVEAILFRLIMLIGTFSHTTLLA